MEKIKISQQKASFEDVVCDDASRCHFIYDDEDSASDGHDVGGDDDDHDDGGYDDDALAPTRHSTYIEFHQDVGGGGVTWQTSSGSSSSSECERRWRNQVYSPPDHHHREHHHDDFEEEKENGDQSNLRLVDNIDENEDTEEGEGVWAKGNATKKQRQTHACTLYREYERQSRNL